MIGYDPTLSVFTFRLLSMHVVTTMYMDLAKAGSHLPFQGQFPFAMIIKSFDVVRTLGVPLSVHCNVTSINSGVTILVASLQ